MPYIPAERNRSCGPPCPGRNATGPKNEGGENVAQEDSESFPNMGCTSTGFHRYVNQAKLPGKEPVAIVGIQRA